MNIVPKNKHILVKQKEMPISNEILQIPILDEKSFVYGQVEDLSLEVNRGEIRKEQNVIFPKLLGIEVGRKQWLIKAEHIVAAVVQR